MAAPRYYPVPSTSFPLAHDVSLVLTHDDNRVSEIDPRAARVLGALTGCRDLRAHADAAVQVGIAANRRDATAVVRRLARNGLLRELRLPRRRKQPPSRAISMVAIVTAGRPRILARCLASLAANCRLSSVAPRIVIIDGSTRERDRVENRRAGRITQSTTPHRVEYVGPSEARALRDRLAAAGVPEATLRFGLTPGATGANRNLAVLLARGEPFLMIDDDVLCAVWRLSGSGSGVAVGGDGDLREYRFFSSRRDAIDAGTPAAIAVVRAHESLLGASLADLVSRAEGDGVDLTDASSELLSAIENARDYRVRASFAGIAGDSGTSCQHLMLFASGALKGRLRDALTFDTALTSREILRISAGPVVTRLPNCMAGCMALSNDAVLPPFLPAGRNADGLFGVMLHFADPLALFGHVPYGVAHDSVRPSRYEPGVIPSATELRLADLLVSLTRRVGFTSFSPSPSARLERLADALSEAASLPRRDFLTRVQKVTLVDRCRRLAELEVRMTGDETYSDRWRTAVARYRRAFRDSAARREFYVPVEFRTRGSIDAAADRAAEFVRGFADLLWWWPRIQEAARGLPLPNDPRRRVGAAMPARLVPPKPAPDAGPINNVVPEHDRSRRERAGDARRHEPVAVVHRRAPRVPAAPEAVEHA